MNDSNHSRMARALAVLKRHYREEPDGFRGIDFRRIAQLDPTGYETVMALFREKREAPPQDCPLYQRIRGCLSSVVGHRVFVSLDDGRELEGIVTVSGEDYLVGGEKVPIEEVGGIAVCPGGIRG